jgi:DNA (cytosine-5)-methyltransferase 1
MGADDYQVSGSLNDALFGFGDAVCVPVVEWIARHALGRPVAAATGSLRGKAASAAWASSSGAPAWPTT